MPNESGKYAGNEEQRRHANLGSQEVRASGMIFYGYASVLAGGLRSGNLCHREERSREYGSEASNWRVEIIQELKAAAWEEEKTFYGPYVNFDTADALWTRSVLYLLFSKGLFFLSKQPARAIILEVQIGRVE